MLEDATTIAAVYAAIVATAALALEVRRWFESGPRLSIGLIAPALQFGGIAPDDAEYIFASVTNRGDLPTTITHLGFLMYRGKFGRWLNRVNFNAIVPQPIFSGGTLPFVLEPGCQWGGGTILDAELRARGESGRLYVAIQFGGSGFPK